MKNKRELIRACAISSQAHIADMRREKHDFKKHLEAIHSAKKKTGLQHEYRDYWYDCCVPVGFKIYLSAECDRRD